MGNFGSCFCWIKDQQQKQLIPGLPDDLGLLILARAPRSSHPFMRLVSKSWNSTMTSDHVFTLRHQLAVTEEWLYFFFEKSQGKYLDLRGAWRQLPSPVYSFGYSVAKLSNFLYVIGGKSLSTGRATSSVWRYDPRTNRWSSVAPMSTPRTYCNTGVISGRLYAVGGDEKSMVAEVSQDSVEVYDPVTGNWTPVASMAFPGLRKVVPEWKDRERMLVTVGMVVLDGRLWVKQAVFGRSGMKNIGGEVYDPVSRTWSKIPFGIEGEAGWLTGTEVVHGRLLLPERYGDWLIRIKEYDVEQDSWRVLAMVAMESPSSFDRLVVWNGQLHLVGINSEDGTVLVLGVDLRGKTGEVNVVASRSFGSAGLVACLAVGI